MSRYGEVTTYLRDDGKVSASWNPVDADWTIIHRDVLEGVIASLNLGTELANLVNEIGDIDQAELATGSRDFGRGVAHALRAVNTLIVSHGKPKP